MFTKMAIFDFDGTLVKSPDRTEGENLYFEATGKMFPFGGWWGRLETLIPPVFPQNPTEEYFIKPIVEAYKLTAQCPQTELILMTGRPYKHRKRIVEILDCQNLKFHQYYFRGQPGQKGRDTLEIKCNFIDDLIHDSLEKLEIYEDRATHVSFFYDMRKKWKNKVKEVIIHDVNSFS